MCLHNLISFCLFVFYMKQRNRARKGTTYSTSYIHVLYTFQYGIHLVLGCSTVNQLCSYVLGFVNMYMMGYPKERYLYV